MRSAFIVFKGTETTIEEYYELLQANIEEAGLCRGTTSTALR